MKQVSLVVLLFGFFQIGKVDMLYAQYQLQKTGTFLINSMNSIDIVDFDPINKTYLAYESGSKGFVVLLIDEKGETIEKKDLHGQGPGQFSSAMNFLGFSENGDVWVITPNQLIAYDRNLNFENSTKFVLDNPFFTYRFSESPSFFYKGDSKENLTFAAYPSLTARFMREKSLETHHLIEMFDMKSKKSYHLAPVAERPIYQHLDNTINAMYKPIFVQDKKNDRLFVTATLDNEITVIELQSGKTLSNIKISHGDFGSFKKTPISDKTLPSHPPYSLASVNMKIISLDGGLLVLDYVREIPYGTFEKNKAEDPTYHHYRDPSYHRLILFDQNKQLSGDIPIPKNGKLMMSMPENRLLFQLVDPEVEEDFIRYDIYEVMKN